MLGIGVISGVGVVAGVAAGAGGVVIAGVGMGIGLPCVGIAVMSAASGAVSRAYTAWPSAERA